MSPNRKIPNFLQTFGHDKILELIKITSVDSVPQQHNLPNQIHVADSGLVSPDSCMDTIYSDKSVPAFGETFSKALS